VWIRGFSGAWDSLERGILWSVGFSELGIVCRGAERGFVGSWFMTWSWSS